MRNEHILNHVGNSLKYTINPFCLQKLRPTRKV
jgi:hypothetical protein